MKPEISMKPIKTNIFEFNGAINDNVIKNGALDRTACTVWVEDTDEEFNIKVEDIIIGENVIKFKNHSVMFPTDDISFTVLQTNDPLHSQGLVYWFANGGTISIKTYF